MKIPLIVALVGLAISFALPTFAQQTNTPNPQLRQTLIAVIAKHADAMNKNAAAAALLTGATGITNYLENGGTLEVAQ
jgi:hypothetical protein